MRIYTGLHIITCGGFSYRVNLFPSTKLQPRNYLQNFASNLSVANYYSTSVYLRMFLYHLCLGWLPHLLSIKFTNIKIFVTYCIFHSSSVTTFAYLLSSMWLSKSSHIVIHNSNIIKNIIKTQPHIYVRHIF